MKFDKSGVDRSGLTPEICALAARYEERVMRRKEMMEGKPDPYMRARVQGLFRDLQAKLDMAAASRPDQRRKQPAPQLSPRDQLLALGRRNGASEEDMEAFFASGR